MKKLTLAIPEESHKRLKVLAAWKGQTMVSILLECINERYEEMEKDKILHEVENEIKSMKTTQNKAEEFLTQLSVEERRKLPPIFWELFGDKYKP